MFSSFATSRRSGSSGTFAVRTGGEHFIPVHAPLGRPLVKKPIAPVPPYYVTEYESAFRWPPEWAYATACANCAKGASCARCDSKVNGDKDKDKKSAGPAPSTSNWQALHNAVTRLLEHNYEKDLMNALKEPVSERRLSLVMDYVNSRLVDTIAAVELHRAENGVYPDEPSRDVLALCKQFTSAVRAIKAC